MANVSFDEISAADVATMLGVQKCTVSYWCRKGYMKFQDVSSAGSNRPRYQFTYDEVNRVQKLLEKYGKNAWTNHANEGLEPVKKPEPELKITVFNQPTEENVEDIAGYVKKIQQLKQQREKLIEDLDALDNAIKTMREKVIAAI